MNAENGHTTGRSTASLAAPSLRQWRPGTDLSEQSPDDVRAWLVDLDSELSPEQMDTVEPGPELAVLSDDERVRAARFVRARDRRRFARCRAALRQILGGLLGESPGSLRFRAVAHGKPEIDFAAMGIDAVNALTDLRFNVSHSSELALIGVCRGREIGVDLEKIRPISESERIVTSYFSAAERAEFAAIAPAARDDAFFRGWTRKEAVLKGLGIGLAGLAAHYETGFGTEKLAAHFIPATPAPRAIPWQLWEAAPRAGFVATVAVEVRTVEEGFRRWS